MVREFSVGRSHGCYIKRKELISLKIISHLRDTERVIARIKIRRGAMTCFFLRWLPLRDRYSLKVQFFEGTLKILPFSDNYRFMGKFYILFGVSVPCMLINA